jgi:hypothetical protein
MSRLTKRIANLTLFLIPLSIYFKIFFALKSAMSNRLSKPLFLRTAKLILFPTPQSVFLVFFASRLL